MCHEMCFNLWGAKNLFSLCTDTDYFLDLKVKFLVGPRHVGMYKLAGL